MKTLQTLFLSASLIMLGHGAFAEGYSHTYEQRSYNRANQYSGENRPANITTRAETQTTAYLSNAQVRDVQESLRDEGYSLSIDGIWGPQTTAAIRDFQRNNNLNATGNLDTRTLSMLDVDVNAGSGQYNRY